MSDSSQSDDPKTMRDAITAIILNREQRIDVLLADNAVGNAVHKQKA